MSPAEIYLAKSGSRRGATLPADSVTRTFGIFGVKDSGKSTTARTLAEGVVKLGGHVVILDPVGVWWGITRRGEGPGLPGIVIGGEHGDVPLEKEGGALVAEFVVGRHYPVVVIDTMLLRKGARLAFLADFLEGVYHSNRRPLQLVFEEADEALPQSPRGMNPTLGRVLGAAEDIVKKGRSRGLGSTFISQRFATVTKNVTTQVECLILHAQPAPQDQKAVKEWVATNGDTRVTDRVMASMASLDVGEAWLYSPKWLKLLAQIRVRKPKTLDSSSTPTDDERELDEQAPRAPVDKAELARQMSEVVERAKGKDPAELKKRIAELEAQLADVKPEVVEVAGERVIVPDAETVRELAESVEVFADAAQAITDSVEHLLSEAEGLDRRITRAEETRREVVDALAAARATLDELKGIPAEGVPVTPAPRAAPAPRPRAAAASNGKPAAPAGDAEDVSPGALKLLDEMREVYPLRLNRIQLATILGRGKKSSTLTQQLAELKDADLIREDGSKLLSAVVTGAQAEMSKGELIDRWRSALPEGPLALLDVLLGLPGGGGIGKDDLFVQAGFSATSSTPVGHLKMLKDNGLAFEPQKKVVMLGPALADQEADPRGAATVR
jgi:hypothetical protein